MERTLNELTNLGIFLKSEHALTWDENGRIEVIFEKFLKSDMRLTCLRGSLPTPIMQTDSAVLPDGIYVLQVLECVDIGEPLKSRKLKPPYTAHRTLKICFTDGFTTAVGVEVVPSQMLTAIDVGAKVLVSNGPMVRRGMLLLEPKHIAVLSLPKAEADKSGPDESPENLGLRVEEIGNQERSDRQPNQQSPPANAQADQQLPPPNAQSYQQPPHANAQADQQLPPPNAQSYQQPPHAHVQANQQLPAVNVQANLQRPHVNAQADQQLPPPNAQSYQQPPQANVLANQQLSHVNVQANLQLPHVNVQANQQLPHVNVQANQQLPRVNAQANQQLPQANVQANQKLPLANVQTNDQPPHSNVHADQKLLHANMQTGQPPPLVNAHPHLQSPQATVQADQQLPQASMQVSQQLPRVNAQADQLPPPVVNMQASLQLPHANVHPDQHSGNQPNESKSYIAGSHPQNSGTFRQSCETVLIPQCDDAPPQGSGNAQQRQIPVSYIPEQPSNQASFSQEQRSQSPKLPCGQIDVLHESPVVEESAKTGDVSQPGGILTLKPSQGTADYPDVSFPHSVRENPQREAYEISPDRSLVASSDAKLVGHPSGPEPGACGTDGYANLGSQPPKLANKPSQGAQPIWNDLRSLTPSQALIALNPLRPMNPYASVTAPAHCVAPPTEDAQVLAQDDVRASQMCPSLGFVSEDESEDIEDMLPHNPITPLSGRDVPESADPEIATTHLSCVRLVEDTPGGQKKVKLDDGRLVRHFTVPPSLWCHAVEGTMGYFVTKGNAVVAFFQSPPEDVVLAAFLEA